MTTPTSSGSGRPPDGDDRPRGDELRRADADVAGGPIEAEESIRADIRAHGGELFHVVRRSVGDDQLAKEIVQDVFVRAWRAHDRFDPTRASRRTWLFAIARNAVIDAVRQRDRRPTVVDEPGEQDAVTADSSERTVLRMQLESALRTLSDDHRRAIVEVQHRGRPYDEVARELGVPVGTLRSRVYYGLRALRDAMQEQGWTHG